MTRPAHTLSLSLFLATSCFSPNENEGAQDTDEANETESETTEAAPTSSTSPPGPTSSTDPTTSSTDPTTDSTDPDTDSTDPTTASTDPDTDSTDPTQTTQSTDDSSSGEPPGPFCGDGNIDFGEECDDGVENNGLTESCLPDCNLNVCGDSNIGPDEFCDDGEDDNVLEIGACAPDCSTIVEEKIIFQGDSIDSGELGSNPVAAADATCPPGHLALFAYPGLRRATVSAYEVSDPIDWVLSPWTFYVRPSGDLVWATDETALLGVRDGAPQALESPIVVDMFSPLEYRVLTGLSENWVTAVSLTCDGWTSSAASVRPGNSTEASYPDFIRGPVNISCSDMTDCPGFPQTCNSSTGFYCVEQ